jgi:hypothetical protein
MVARRYCTEHLARGQLSQAKHAFFTMRSAPVSGPTVPKCGAALLRHHATVYRHGVPSNKRGRV